MAGKKQVLVILAEGFEEIEAIAPIDVLTRSGCEVTVAGLVPGPIAAAYGTTIMPQTTLDQVTERLYDGIFFPGGRKNAQALAASPKVIALAKKHHEAGRLVAAICAAPSHVLGEAAGLLKGKRASGDPSFNDKLAFSGAIVTQQMVTVDGNIMTGVGPGAAMLFALQMAEYLCGKEIADQFAAKWKIDRQ
jgi:protein deglycase